MVVSFEAFIETENSCCVPRFPLIASCYRIVDSQTSFTLRSRRRRQKFWKGWSRTFYLRLRILASNITKELVQEARKMQNQHECVKTGQYLPFTMT